MPKNPQSSNIISLIKDHHFILKDAIKVLKDYRGTPLSKRKKLTQFLEAFKMHAISEEETLYERMRTLPKMRILSLEAAQEHKIAESLAEELEGLRYQDQWNDEISAKAKVLASLVEHHLLEEEKEILPLIKLQLSRAELLDLGREYLARCNEHIENNLAKHRPYHMPSHSLL